MHGVGRGGSPGSGEPRSLRPLVPELAATWDVDAPGAKWRALEGTLVFADISGFTRLSERLAARGRVGAEELTEVLGRCFADLLAVAYERGGGLLKFGGDALLLLFRGDRHAQRAAWAAIRMRQTMGTVGLVTTSVGQVRLRMSIGLHSGLVHLFRAGRTHGELVIAGPAATQVVRAEAAAGPGEVVVSPAAARLLPSRLLTGDGTRLARLRRTSADDEIAPVHIADPTIDVTASIPASLRDHLRLPPEPEHRHAAIAFVHFDGTDHLLAADGPEVTAAAIDELVTDVQAAVAEEAVTFLGTDVDGDGGKVILVAGAPRSVEDAEGRMLRAVRAIASGHRLLPVRIGVHRGHVFAGEVGPPYRRTYTVMGDAVNLSARLMAKARPGEVLATPAVLDRSRSAFDVQKLAPFTVKGKVEPVEAYLVGERCGARPAVGAGDDLPVIGRTSELHAIGTAVDAAGRGRGSMLELVGGPGAGKTRLALEVQACAGDLPVLSTSCQAYESTTPYAAVGRVLRQILGLPPHRRSQGAASLVRRRIEPIAPGLAPLVPLLAGPLGVDIPDTDATRSLEPQHRRSRAADVVVEVLAALAAGPAVLVVEDAHWMDDASAEVLGRIEAELWRHPWLIVVTRRPGQRGFLPGGAERTTTLELGPLDPAATAELLRTATEDAPLRPHEVEAVAARSGGNPSFALALVRALSVEGPDHLPDSVDAVLSARIDQLDPAPRRLVRLASVLGTRFGWQELAAVATGEVDLGDQTTWDAVADLLEVEDHGTVRFRQELVREVAYEGLTFRRREELHRRAAQLLEQASSDRSQVAGVLSLHLLRAHRYEDARRTAAEAADRARAAYANVEAAALYRRALTAARHSPDRDAAELARMCEALGDVSDRSGEFDAAQAAYREARGLAPATEQARLCLKEAQLAERQGRVVGAVRWVRRGLRSLEGATGERADGERAQLLAWEGALRLQQGRAGDGVAACRRAIEAAQIASHQQALAHAYFILDCCLVDLGRADEAVHAERALAIYEELGDESGSAVVANNLGAFAYFEGRWDDALALYERARSSYERVGDLLGGAVADLNITEVLTDQGRLDEAEVTVGAALAVFRAARYEAGLATAVMRQARILSHRGQHGRAGTLLADARDRFEALGAAVLVLEVDIWRVESLILSGQAGAARALALAAIASDEARGGHALHGAILHRLAAYAAAAQHDLVEAWAHLDQSLAIGRERGAPYEVALTLEAFSIIAERQHRADIPRPAVAPEDRHEIFRRLGVRALPAVPLPAS